MTPITADSVPGYPSLSSKVSRSKQRQQRNKLLRSNERHERLVSLVRREVPSIENPGYSEPHPLKIFLPASRLQIWLKFRKSSHFGGTLASTQRPIQELKDIQDFSPPTTIVIFHLRTHLMNSRASNSLLKLVLEITHQWRPGITRRRGRGPDRTCICLEVISRTTQL